MGPFFWWSVGFIYFGLAVLLIDLCFEKFEKHDWARAACAAVIVLIIISFTVGVVFKSAEIAISSYALRDHHAKGSVFAGIVWADERATDLRVHIANDSDLVYQDLDILINTDAYILAASQNQMIPRCEFGLGNSLEAHARFTDTGGKRYAISPSVSATAGIGYRLICGSFPAHSAVTLVFSTIDAPSSPGISVDAVQTPNMGIRNPPSRVSVKGSYTARMRPRDVSTKVPVEMQ